MSMTGGTRTGLADLFRQQQQRERIRLGDPARQGTSRWSEGEKWLPEDDSLEGRLNRLATEARRKGLSQKQATEAIRKAIGEAALEDEDDDWICERASSLMERALEGSRNVVRYDEEMDAAEMDAEAFLRAHRPPLSHSPDGWDDIFRWVSTERRPALVRTIKKVLEGEIATVRVSEGGGLEQTGVVRDDDLVEVVAHVMLDRPVRFRVEEEEERDGYWTCDVCGSAYTHSDQSIACSVEHGKREGKVTYEAGAMRRQSAEAFDKLYHAMGSATVSAEQLEAHMRGILSTYGKPG